MKNDTENTQAGSDCQERLVLPLWAEYGEGPPKRGDYNIRIQAKGGCEKEIAAWHNPGNGHWLIGPKECGYVDIIQPPGETEEWRITHWQERLVRHLWVQYGHEDEKTAPVIQTADSEQEARDEDETVMSGCCWYRYDIEPGEGDGKLTNANGPHYLTNA